MMFSAEENFLYETILKLKNEQIKEQQEEIDRLTIAYQNASDQRQHYVEKCLKLSEVLVKYDSMLSILDTDYPVLVFRDLHKDLINELKHNLCDSKIESINKE